MRLGSREEQKENVFVGFLDLPRSPLARFYIFQVLQSVDYLKQDCLQQDCLQHGPWI
jgi:hypothetical protein